MKEEEKLNNMEEEETPQQQVPETDNSAETDNQAETDQPEVSVEKDPLDVALDEIADLKDKYLRSVAEFDNYRKRTLKERAELILNGGEKVITAVLPVIDDMERAIENGKKTDDPEVLREGMELIHQKLMKILEAQGVSLIDTDAADFDTDVHEAVAMVPGMGDDKKGKVIDCLQKGYKLNDKVIRHAKVAVGQ
ncbi:MAG: nucleotide exchange factor GrpE [Prevotella sp.]|jgi:molecular chaperone GrpE|nr:nucleotide exchange factor GrpE [Prevotella sp.]